MPKRAKQVVKTAIEGRKATKQSGTGSARRAQKTATGKIGRRK